MLASASCKTGGVPPTPAPPGPSQPPLRARPAGPPGQAPLEAAKARAREGDLDGAIQKAKAALRENPELEVAYLFLGSACAMQRDAACERKAYTRGLQAIPSSAPLHRELGLLELGEGRVEHAVTRYERALELAGPDQAEYLADLAYAYVYATRLADAEPLAERAVTLAPRCFACWMAHAQVGLSKKNYTRAATSYRMATRITPDSTDAQHGLAKALFLDGKLDEAAELYRVLVSGAPQDFRLRVQAAQVAMSRARYQEAAAFLAPVAAANPEERKLLELLFEAQTKSGDRTGAAKTRKRLNALKGD